MTDLASQARPSIEKLLQSDENQLYEELGMRIKAYQNDLSVGASFSPVVEYRAELMGPLDDLKLFGRVFFQRMNLWCAKNSIYRFSTQCNVVTC